MGNSNYLGTYNGSIFYPLDKEINDVNIEAIAYALSHNCRFCGHTNKMWTIAQHSLLVENILNLLDFKDKIISKGLNEAEVKVVALLHDASEAYLSDICRPVKVYLNDYLNFENIIMSKIIHSVGMTTERYNECWEIVKQADDLALYAEAIALMNPSERWKTDCKKYFDNQLIHRVAPYIKQNNSCIVEMTYLKELNRQLIKSGLDLSLFDKLDEITHSFDEDYTCLFNAGKFVGYYYKEINGYTFKYKNKTLQITDKVVENTLDLYNLLDMYVEETNEYVG